MLNGHGDDLHNYGEIKYNFSSNVYYEGCSLELIGKIEKSLGKCINNYPSPTAEELSVLVADRYDLSSSNFLFFNGATEAFYTIAQLFQGESATIFAPTFAEYEGACDVHGVTIEWKSRELFHEKVNTPIAFVCNPNNPDGSFVSQEEVETFLSLNSETILVVDEAYIEFTKAVNSVVNLCENHENLIVVRSLTKVFAIPGLRLGYVASNPEMIEQLVAKKMPWSVNALAIRAGELIFENYEHWHFSIEKLTSEMNRFTQQLSSIAWLNVLPTSTTYVLIELKKGTAAELKDYLANEQGILIRDATNFTKLEGEYIRVSLQSKEVNEILINALKKC